MGQNYLCCLPSSTSLYHHPILVVANTTTCILSAFLRLHPKPIGEQMDPASSPHSHTPTFLHSHYSTFFGATILAWRMVITSSLNHL